MPPPRHAAWVALRPGREHHCRGRLGDSHMPGGRRPLSPANVGVAEDWGQVVWRIKEDLKWLFKHFALWRSILRINEIIKRRFAKQTNAFQSRNLLLISQLFCRKRISFAEYRTFCWKTNCWRALTMCYADKLMVLPEHATLAPPRYMQIGWGGFADWTTNNANRCIYQYWLWIFDLLRTNSRQNKKHNIFTKPLKIMFSKKLRFDQLAPWVG